MTGNLDLIVASQVMIHLIDPLGTLVQLTNLLKEGGFLLSNSFTFNMVDRNEEEIFSFSDEIFVGYRLSYLLTHSKTKFLTCPEYTYKDNLEVYFPDIIIQKTSSINFSYTYHQDPEQISDFCTSTQTNIKTFGTKGIEGRLPFLYARMCNIIEIDNSYEDYLDDCATFPEIKEKYTGDIELFQFVKGIYSSNVEIDTLGNLQEYADYCHGFTIQN